MKKYNVGIVGYGWVATAHIPAINASPLGQVTAVFAADRSAELGRPVKMSELKRMV
jgi:predicted dehydrogenase